MTPKTPLGYHDQDSAAGKPAVNATDTLEPQLDQSDRILCNGQYLNRTTENSCSAVRFRNRNIAREIGGSRLSQPSSHRRTSYRIHRYLSFCTVLGVVRDPGHLADLYQSRIQTSGNFVLLVRSHAARFLELDSLVRNHVHHKKSRMVHRCFA